MDLKQTDNNRRVAPRFRSEKPTAIDLKYSVDGAWKAVESYYVNLSSNGMTALASTPIPLGASVDIRLTLQSIQKEFALKGRVKWSTLSENAPTGYAWRYMHGIEFEISKENDAKALQEALQQSPISQDKGEGRRAADRRKTQTDITRRKFNRRTKEFLFEKTVFLSDTNAVGNTYFAKHFEWQGIIREAFLLYILPDFQAFFHSGVRLVTVEASSRYYHESTLYDSVLMSLKLGKVRNASCEMFFIFKNKRTGQVLSEGRQVIAFVGPQGKPIPMPDVLISGIKPFLHK